MLDILLNLVGIMISLRKTVMEHALRDRANQAMLIAAGYRFCRSLERLRGLYDRFRTGTLPAARVRASRAGQAAAPRAAARVRFSGKRTWLVAICGWQTAGVGGHLQYWLEHPDMPVFFAAVPQAGRYLRPLIHALGIEVPDCLRLPPRPRKPRTPKPRKPRQGPVRGLSKLSGAQLHAMLAPIPPHFNLPIPGWRTIRRKIREYEAGRGAT